MRRIEMSATIRRTLGRGRFAAVAIVIAAVLVAPLGAVAAQSKPMSAFDSWGSWTAGDAEVVFAADTATVHSGMQALRIRNATPRSLGVYGAISQGIAVEPSTTYEFRMWVKAESAPAQSAFVIYSSSGGQEFLPAGTTGWEEISWTYTTGATEEVLPFAIAVQDRSTYWIDTISVVAKADDWPVMANGGFEDSTNDIAVDRAHMFFEPGDVTIPIVSPTASVEWTVRNERAATVGSGVADTSSGSAVLDFSTYEPGYYTLDLSGLNAERSTSFAIVDGIGTPLATATSRFGTTLHPTIHPGVEQATMAEKLGFGQVRLDLRWETIETTPGVYNWDAATDAEVARLIARGIRPVLIAAYYGPYDDGRTPHSAEGIAGYADFVAAAAERYGPDVDIEIYNEYNFGYSNSLCGQTPACYLELLAPAADAIRAVEPGVRIIGPVIGGLTPAWLDTDEAYDWLAEFFALGGLDYIDIVSVHSYAAPDAPEGHNEEVVARLKTLMVQYPAASRMPLWFTETGYHTIGVDLGGVSELMQARYLVRDAALTLAQGLDVYMLYGMLDDWPDPLHPEANFGLVRNPAGQKHLLAPKPAFVAHAVLTRQLERRTYSHSEQLPGGAHSIVFSDAARGELRVMWATTDTSVNIAASGPVTVTDQFGKIRVVTPVEGRVQLPLTQDAVYVTGPGLRLEASAP